MTTQNQDEMDRRSFLKVLALTAASATTAGGAAGYLANKAGKAPLVTTVSEPPPSAPPLPSPSDTVFTANDESAEALAQLAAAQAENMKLKAELDAAQRRLEALEAANGDTGQLNEDLQVELAEATEQVSLLAGLVALYDQLDDANLLQTVEGHVTSFGNVIGELVGELPGAEEGLALGNQALDNFEAQIPLLKEGRRWLESHLARLATFYDAAENVLEAAVESAGSFLQKLNDWFQGLRKWLPFGVGDRAAEVMSALANVLDETPQTIHGLRRNVADPLDVWLKGEETEMPLRADLIKPLKEKSLARAGTVVERARETQTAYETELVDPLQTAVDRRRRLREQIAAYRQEHGV